MVSQNRRHAGISRPTGSSSAAAVTAGPLAAGSGLVELPVHVSADLRTAAVADRAGSPAVTGASSASPPSRCRLEPFLPGPVPDLDRGAVLARCVVLRSRPRTVAAGRDPVQAPGVAGVIGTSASWPGSSQELVEQAPFGRPSALYKVPWAVSCRAALASRICLAMAEAVETGLASWPARRRQPGCLHDRQQLSSPARLRSRKSEAIIQDG